MTYITWQERMDPMKKEQRYELGQREQVGTDQYER